MAELFALTAETVEQLNRLIGTRPGTTTTPAPAGGEQGATHVKVTGAISGSSYPCVPTRYDSVAGAWTEFDAALCKAPNGEKLYSGVRYMALRTGTDVATSKGTYQTQQPSIKNPMDCAKMAWLDAAADCVTATTYTGTGRCSTIAEQTVTLHYNEVADAFISEHKVETPGAVVHSPWCAKGVYAQYKIVLSGFSGGTGCTDLNGVVVVTSSDGQTWTGSINGHAVSITTYEDGGFVYCSLLINIGGSDQTWDSQVSFSTSCCSSIDFERNTADFCGSTPLHITATPIGKKWSVKYTKPTCTKPMSLSFIGAAPGGSGTPPEICLQHVGCDDGEVTFSGGGKVLCGDCGTGGQCETGVFLVKVNCGSCWDWITTSCNWVIPSTLCVTMSSADDPTWNQTISIMHSGGNQWLGKIFAGGTVYLVTMLACYSSGTTVLLEVSNGTDPIATALGSFIGGRGGSNTSVPTTNPFHADNTFVLVPLGYNVTYTIDPCAGAPPVTACCNDLDADLDTGIIPTLSLDVVGTTIDMTPDPYAVGMWDGVFHELFADIPYYAWCVNGVVYVGKADGGLSQWYVPESSACNPLDVSYASGGYILTA